MGSSSSRQRYMIVASAEAGLLGVGARGRG